MNNRIYCNNKIMDEHVVYTVLCDDHLAESLIEDTSKQNGYHERSSHENVEKNSAVWTSDSINTLLRLYESKLGMLTTPKKKTRIWVAISDSLKTYNIEVSPDQVRWKINALTKKYKQCIDSGQNNRFKYFTQLNNIYAQYNPSSYTTSGLAQKINIQEVLSPSEAGMQPESKATIELRKSRLANKIESDRCQSKVQLEKQWLEYLTRQEEQRLLNDEVRERNLQLRQEQLELRKRELETRESIELRRLQLMEKEQEEVFKLEREKCDMLKKILLQKIQENFLNFMSD